MIELRYSGEAFEYDSSVFVGREDEIAWATEQLAQGQRRLAIYGMPKIGKTWLLHALADHLRPAYLPIYLDVRSLANESDEPPLLHLAAALAEKLGDRAQGVGGWESVGPATAAHLLEDPHGGWQGYVEDLKSQVSGQQPILLLDHVTSAPLEWLSILIQTPLPLILAVGSRDSLLAHLSDVAFPGITLGALAYEPASELIKALLSPLAPIDAWAVRRILEITTGHPYYIHLFCQALIACCAQATLITPMHVETALQEMLQVPIPEFVVGWEGSTPYEQAILAAFSSLRGLGGVATPYDVQKVCARYDRVLPLQLIQHTLDQLVHRGVLEKMGANTYRFRLELYRLWLDHRHRPEEVFRTRRWQLRGAFLNGLLSRVQQALAKRRMVWLSIGAVALVLLIVGIQPGLWRREAKATPTPAVARTRPLATKVASIPTATPVPEPRLPLPDMDLAIMSNEGAGASWQLYAVDSRTGERVRLTETTANERTPKWSPDGRRIVFSSDRDGDRDIYVMDLGTWLQEGVGYQPVNLTHNDEPDWQPAWSPDGMHIAFSSYRDGNWEIYVINADGTDPMRVTEQIESDYSPAWSPDGSKLLFVSRRRGDADLFTYEFATRKLVKLTSSALDEYDPAWSPDGQWIAYVTRFEPQSDIFIMQANGLGAINLTNSSYVNELQPCWTPDSEQLVFTAYISAKGNYDLYAMQRDGGEVRLLLDPDTDDVAPSLREVAPDTRS
jgi:Tol biopolymer transport system component